MNSEIADGLTAARAAVPVGLPVLGGLDEVAKVSGVGG